ncbi:MAG: hypothetical protein ABI439_07095 [Rhodospirillales bacterium]
MADSPPGRPYREDYFRPEFERIRSAAGLRSDLQFRDLRGTADVRVADASISAPMIAAVTGHSIDHATKIIEIYLPRITTMAREANASWKTSAARTRSVRKLEVQTGNHRKQLEGADGVPG